MNQTIKALNWRYATKKFSTQKIPEEKLAIIFEALRLTPSSLGLQAWRFLIIENPDIREKLKEVSWNQEQVVDASHLIVLARPISISDKDVTKWTHYLADKRNMTVDSKDRFEQMILNYLKTVDEDQQSIWLDKQLYIALGNLMTSCALEGIDSCPIEGFDPAAYDRILQLEEKGLKSVVVCPIGYRADDDPYQHEAKVRFPKDELFLHF